MNRLRLSAILTIVALISLDACAARSSCVPTTAELAKMADAQVRFSAGEGAEITFPIKIADDNAELAAGFQHICPKDVEGTAIWFQFPVANHSAFHMHNVHAPLDIAFLDESGRVMEIQRMETYSLVSIRPTLYRPDRPYHSALETAAGRLATLGIQPGMKATVEGLTDARQ